MAVCLSLNDINNNNGSVVENTNGTVSVYLPTGPVILNKFCCEALNPTKNYVFDIDTQKCTWKNVSLGSCSLDPLKITLNPKGNDGSLFYIGDTDETCTLKIDFDYLFKVKCETLGAVLNNTGKSVLQLEAEEQIKTIETTIEKQTVICEDISTRIDVLTITIAKTNYSISCTQGKVVPTKVVSTSSLTPFQNTGFAPLAFASGVASYNTTKTYCLTDEGLIYWNSLLGNNYTNFLNGDPTSYTCKHVAKIVEKNASIVNSNVGNPIQQPILLFECTTPFGTKTNLINDLTKLQEEQKSCENVLTTLTTRLTEAKASLTVSECLTPVDVLETLDVSVTLEVVDDFNNATTVATYPLFPSIGSGNLYTYLTTNTNSGFLVCGTDDTSNECVPMYLNTIGNPNEENVFACSQVTTSILGDLFTESALPDTVDGKATFNSSLSTGALASKWLHYETNVTDVAILEIIKNKKIKISLNVNKSCSDFCVLMDNIQLNKDCSIVSENNMFITQSPGFELDRIRDNKKSWVSNTTLERREFDIKAPTGSTIIRQTDYYIEDERLLINTKEIDLDISLASAIETDVWCYISDNPCLLSGSTTCEPCLNACCGDNMIDFDTLMTQSLSGITTVEDFEYFITSELIDAKSRKTLSAYPTLRALYDRYMNSFDYCDTNSSRFDYVQMDQFSHLIDSYWVDLVEQVVPATTIWGSVKIYGNTIFDQQKFQYKKSSLFSCTDDAVNQIASASTVGVDTITITGEKKTQSCNGVYIKQIDNGSGFIGTIQSISTTSMNNNNFISKF